jgi:hypothetical membrane protein
MFAPEGRSNRAVGVAGGLVFILVTVQYAIAQLIAASAWQPAYSWSKNVISDLGNTACGQFAVPHANASYVCSPDHVLMNGSFVLSGALTLIGTILLWRVWPSRRMTRIALILWLVAGVLKVVVGLVPENTNLSLHLLGAVNIPVESVAILLLSIAIAGGHRGLSRFGVAIGIVGLAGAAFTTAAQYAGSALNLGLGNGGMERVAGYPGSLWMLVIGIALVSHPRRRATRAANRIPDHSKARNPTPTPRHAYR